jgi:hypothetical protein
VSQTYIPTALRQTITDRARNRCGYCQVQAEVIGQDMQIDHIIPEAEGGETEEANLWLACVSCNQRKAVRTRVLDFQTGELVPLFNPVAQLWYDHFRWSEDGTEMVGLTPTGRATIDALQLNRNLLLKSRKRWVLAGFHPPER